MALPVLIHVDYSGEFTVVFSQGGSPVDLSGASVVTMEVFDTPGTPLETFDSDTDPGNFDTSGLDQGELVFKWAPETFSNETFLAGAVTARHSLRFAIETADWPSPGRVIPNYLAAVFSE